jgi:class 3 adenylate cyclase
MDINRINELGRLTHRYYNIAKLHIEESTEFSEELRKRASATLLTEESEIPSYENKLMKFGKFENREFVVMMTDIRASTDIINGPNGLISMFLIFYIYAGIIANIVDSYNGTSTEFLGDGVLNLFDTKEIGRDQALRLSLISSWDIMEAKDLILNPFFAAHSLPMINIGIGIDHGMTIVTRFGYRKDTDLKAFGTCVYNASKLCKGNNEIRASQNSISVWPTNPGGLAVFGSPLLVDEKIAYPIYKGAING